MCAFGWLHDCLNKEKSTLFDIFPSLRVPFLGPSTWKKIQKHWLWTLFRVLGHCAWTWYSSIKRTCQNQRCCCKVVFKMKSFLNNFFLKTHHQSKSVFWQQTGQTLNVCVCWIIWREKSFFLLNSPSSCKVLPKVSGWYIWLTNFFFGATGVGFYREITKLIIILKNGNLYWLIQFRYNILHLKNFIFCLFT